jgi:LAS superfamily LD-carboxypeptidase LdcB
MNQWGHIYKHPNGILLTQNFIAHNRQAIDTQTRNTNPQAFVPRGLINGSFSFTERVRATREGRMVVSAIDGIVNKSEIVTNSFRWGGTFGGRGNYVEIQGDRDFSHIRMLYAHFHEVFVKTGDKVTRGQVIGTEGDTGLSTGQHLHLECYNEGVPFCPISWFKTSSPPIPGETPDGSESSEGGYTKLLPELYLLLPQMSSRLIINLKDIISKRPDLIKGVLLQTNDTQGFQNNVRTIALDNNIALGAVVDMTQESYEIQAHRIHTQFQYLPLPFGVFVRNSDADTYEMFMQFLRKYGFIRQGYITGDVERNSVVRNIEPEERRPVVMFESPNSELADELSVDVVVGSMIRQDKIYSDMDSVDPKPPLVLLQGGIDEDGVLTSDGSKAIFGCAIGAVSEKMIIIHGTPKSTGDGQFNELLRTQLREYGWAEKGLTDTIMGDLNETIQSGNIATLTRFNHFISQCAHESGMGSFTVEQGSDAYLSYLEGRTDLGNINPGDGLKFRGAGYIQLTGRTNYQAFADYIGDQRVMEGYAYVAEHYPWASAGWFWKTVNMNDNIDGGWGVFEVTKQVNGGTIGLLDRLSKYDKAVKTFTSEALKPPEQTTAAGVGWELQLFNQKNPLSENYISTISLSDIGGQQIDSRVSQPTRDMIDAAQQVGIILTVISGYRSIAVQETLFRNSFNAFVSAGHSRSAAFDLEVSHRAVPRTSEHNAAIAVDFNHISEAFDQTSAFTWLNNNAHNYGFILRYPKGSQPTTGIIYEPWHWRYVGVDNAKKIRDSGKIFENYYNDHIGKCANDLSVFNAWRTQLVGG